MTTSVDVRDAWSCSPPAPDLDGTGDFHDAIRSLRAAATDSYQRGGSFALLQHHPVTVSINSAKPEVTSDGNVG